MTAAGAATAANAVIAAVAREPINLMQAAGPSKKLFSKQWEQAGHAGSAGKISKS